MWGSRVFCVTLLSLSPRLSPTARPQGLAIMPQASSLEPARKSSATGYSVGLPLVPHPARPWSVLPEHDLLPTARTQAHKVGPDDEWRAQWERRILLQQ